jgi:heme-degrading monooxygenase HmoA
MEDGPSGSFNSIARTPEPPYYAVVFTSVRTPADPVGYALMADRMVELASSQPGFLGFESVRDAHGAGITVSYWSSLVAIRHWREHSEHQVAQSQGRSSWYREYRLRVCRVEREIQFPSDDTRGAGF